MTRAVLYENPSDPEAWLRWGWHHKDSHDRIRQAIQNKGTVLSDYPIDPITKRTKEDFLQYNSQMHSDMDAYLNLQASDLLSVNLDDERQKLAWIDLHAKEHESAELALGL